MAEFTSKPTDYADFSVNQDLSAINSTDANDNPTGGVVVGPGLNVKWQDGPRAMADGSLAAPNGAFVEDLLWAALQRLEFFQTSKYKDRRNAIAADSIKQALDALKNRSDERARRGTLGKHEV